MADPRSRRLLVERLGWLGLALSATAILAALIAALGSGQEWWHFRVGFTVLRVAFFMALAGGLLGLIALLIPIRDRRRRVTTVALGGLILGALLASYIGVQARAARMVPPIHDITTNVDDPPRFFNIPLRTDNFDIVPHLGRNDLYPLPPEERWKIIHRESYGDLKSLQLPIPPAQAIRLAADIARDKGWQFATITPDGGVMEATDTTRWFRFKDDIVVRARRLPNNNALVDVRSVSRVGVSDIGTNAKRIRSFLAEMKDRATRQRAL